MTVEALATPDPLVEARAEPQPAREKSIDFVFVDLLSNNNDCFDCRKERVLELFGHRRTLDTS